MAENDRAVAPLEQTAHDMATSICDGLIAHCDAVGLVVSVHIEIHRTDGTRVVVLDTYGLHEEAD